MHTHLWGSVRRTIIHADSAGGRSVSARGGRSVSAGGGRTVSTGRGRPVSAGGWRTTGVPTASKVLEGEARTVNWRRGEASIYLRFRFIESEARRCRWWINDRHGDSKISCL